MARPWWSMYKALFRVYACHMMALLSSLWPTQMLIDRSLSWAARFASVTCATRTRALEGVSSGHVCQTKSHEHAGKYTMQEEDGREVGDAKIVKRGGRTASVFLHDHHRVFFSQKPTPFFTS